MPEEGETEGALDVEARERELASLEREIALCKQLRHKHIVGYIGAKKVSPTELYVFLEYVPGGSIAQMLTRFGCFNEQLVRHYTRQLLLGLEYLHGCKVRHLRACVCGSPLPTDETSFPLCVPCQIIHRDLKGANVLVSRDGVVKLADFGAATLARAIHDNKAAHVSHGIKSMRGSLFWMAPEVRSSAGSARAEALAVHAARSASAHVLLTCCSRRAAGAEGSRLRPAGRRVERRLHRDRDDDGQAPVAANGEHVGHHLRDCVHKDGPAAARGHLADRGGVSAAVLRDRGRGPADRNAAAAGAVRVADHIGAHVRARSAGAQPFVVRVLVGERLLL